MMKRIFKICLLVTVVSLIGALALLPFAVNGMVNQLDKWAEYSAYQVDYERSAEGIANMEVKFEGIERIYCAVEVGNSGTDGLRLSTDGLQIYDITTTEEVEGDTLRLTVHFALKPEFSEWSNLVRFGYGSTPFETAISVPAGVEVSFDESDCNVHSYQVLAEQYETALQGFREYCGEPLYSDWEIYTALNQYMVGNYNRAEFNAAFDRAAADILSDVTDTIRNSETEARSRDEEYRYEMDPEQTMAYAADGEEAVIYVTAGEMSTDSGLPSSQYGSQPLPEDTYTLVETYLNAVRDYLALSADCWCAMNADAALLRDVITPLETLRSQRTAAQEAVTAARRALSAAIDGCIYSEYIYQPLYLEDY